ncbi:MAG: transposase domain-containing protein [Burkholderiaceae bacterium]
MAACLLARVVPASLVHAVLDEHGCNTQRARSFPAVAGVYFCVALSLYPDAGYEEVFAAVAQGLAWAGEPSVVAPVGKSSISALRGRIGAAPLHDLVRRCCLPLANPRDHPQAFYVGLRLVAIGAGAFDLADEAANAQEFGRPVGHDDGAAAGRPQARCAALVECATQAILAAGLGSCRESGRDLAASLLPRLEAGMLCVAGRAVNSFGSWRRAISMGADLLWQSGAHWKTPVERMLEDGSFLTTLDFSDLDRPSAEKQVFTARVVDCAPPGAVEAPPRKLLTTLLDPRQAPARDLATLHQRHCAVESVFDGLQAGMPQRGRTLRSKTPELVRQEFHGWVLAHYATRWLASQRVEGAS